MFFTLQKHFLSTILKCLKHSKNKNPALQQGLLLGYFILIYSP